MGPMKWALAFRNVKCYCVFSGIFLNVHHKVNCIPICQLIRSPSYIFLRSLLYAVFITGFLKLKLIAVLSKYHEHLQLI